MKERKYPNGYQGLPIEQYKQIVFKYLTEDYGWGEDVVIEYINKITEEDCKTETPENWVFLETLGG